MFDICTTLCQQVWIFGKVWCQIWLAVDVWMCTASILNLCVISLDRYVAVARPLAYPRIMSPYRAKLLIAAIWIVSFIICFPPLVGWKDSKVSKLLENIFKWDEHEDYTRYIILKIYTTLGYIVSLILLNLGHVFRFRIVSRMCQLEEEGSPR